MSLDTTSLRFELIKPKAKLKMFLKSEQERILRDEREADFEKQSRIDYLRAKMADWYDNLDEYAERKRNKQNRKNLKKDIKNATQAVVSVRRAALEEVLKEDHQIYKQELAKMGKAFYVQRM